MASFVLFQNPQLETALLTKEGHHNSARGINKLIALNETEF